MFATDQETVQIVQNPEPDDIYFLRDRLIENNSAFCRRAGSASAGGVTILS